MWWRWIRRVLGLSVPSYKILVGRSYASAPDAAEAAAILVVGSGAQALGIAASALCCPGEDGPPRVEWDVYVLIRR